MAFKAVYDSYVIGVDLDNDLLDILKDLEQHWFISDEEDEVWMSHVLQGTPNLLSVGFDKKKVRFKLIYCIYVRFKLI